MSTIWAFDDIEKKHTLYRRKDSTKINLLREHAKNIIDYEKKKLLALTKEELNPHIDTKECYIWGQRILQKLTKIKSFWRVKDHWYYAGKCRGAAHSTWNLKFHVPNKIYGKGEKTYKY